MLFDIQPQGSNLTETENGSIRNLNDLCISKVMKDLLDKVNRFLLTNIFWSTCLTLNDLIPKMGYPAAIFD